MLSRSTLFAILSSQIRVYTVCHSQQFGQGQQYLLFSVWSSSTLFAILNSHIRVYTVCNSQQYDQCLNYLPFSVWSGSTVLAIFSMQYYQGLHCLPYSAVWTGSTLLAILSNLISVYTFSHSFYAVLSRSPVCQTQQSDKDLHYQQCDQGLHCLPFSAVRSVPTLFAILSLIRVYTVCISPQSGGAIYHIPFSAVWSRSRCTLSFLGTVRSRSILYVILCSLIRVCTICHSQHYDRSLHFLPFSAFWSGSILFSTLSILIRVYTICHYQQSE